MGATVHKVLIYTSNIILLSVNCQEDMQEDWIIMHIQHTIIKFRDNTIKHISIYLLVSSDPVISTSGKWPRKKSKPLKKSPRIIEHISNHALK